MCLLKQLHVGGSFGCQRDGSRSKAAATAQTVLSPRTPESRCGPCRVQPPHSSTETDDGKGQGRGERDEQRHGPEDSSPQGGKHRVLYAGRSRVVLAARPTPLVEVRPQPGVLRQTVAHFVDLSPFVQILDDPVPQMGEEQVLDFLQKIDALALVEQVIAVPKISLDQIPQRCPRRRPRRAEQLVEVPTIISYSSLQQRIAEQIIDIPFPQGRGGRDVRGGLQGFSQRQSSTACSGTDHVDTPVPQSRGGGGGLLGFRPDPNSAASSSRSCAVDEPFQGFFSHFSPEEKSAGLGPHSRSELGADFTSWTPTAYAESMALDDDESEAESESVEEGAATRFAAGFRPLRVCTRFLEHQMGRPVWGCAYGDRCTFAHSWAELHPEASAHEQQLASYFPE